jgi:4-hydroxy-tetrahydrodipicolinate reductase
MRYALAGHGRMGKEIERVAGSRGHTCVAILDPSEGSPGGVRGARLAAERRAEIAFEFTTPAVAPRNVEALLRAGISVVCGTTGWNPADRKIRAALRASGKALVVEPNFSVGMQLFQLVVAQAARSFGASRLYEPWIAEAHHRGKADAPSGTARRLAQMMVEQDPSLQRVHTGPLAGALAPGALQVTSVRAGHEPGMHSVGFDGEHDVVTLTHRARGRGGFALGAVLTAEWLRRRRGEHAFAEVLESLAGSRTPKRRKRA